MEKNSGYLPESSDIESIDHDMYFALEKPLLDEILRTDREGNPKRVFAIDYFRPTPDNDLEKVGMVISDRQINDSGVIGTSYDVTIFYYKEDAEHTLDSKDSIAFVVTETSNGSQCQTDAMYANGMYIARHAMNLAEHRTLLNELLATREWQLASQYEHDILSK
jgi:hypothetical protein